MTDRERMIKGLKENGFEVSVIGNTIQWTNPSWTTIVWFDKDGKVIKSERA